MTTRLQIKLIFIFLLIFLSFKLRAQEFQVSVQVVSNRVEGSDKNIYNTLQQALNEFVNNRHWSNYDYKPEERIEGTIMINVKERSNDIFSAEITLALRRPVYNSSYYSPLLSSKDSDFTFKYVEFQAIEYADNTFTSNLTEVIAYYLYVFLGIDGDSFSLNGGSQFFEKAYNIVTMAQNVSDKGWKSFESDKNRYWLIENFTNPSYSAIREAIYRYHRLGLDKMTEDVEVARSAIIESLELLRKANRERPGLYLLQTFLSTKRDELINIFTGASPVDKTTAVNILKEIDPANISKYDRILQARN